MNMLFEITQSCHVTATISTVDGSHELLSCYGCQKAHGFLVSGNCCGLLKQYHYGGADLHSSQSASVRNLKISFENICHFDN